MRSRKAPWLSLLVWLTLRLLGPLGPLHIQGYFTLRKTFLEQPRRWRTRKLHGTLIFRRLKTVGWLRRTTNQDQPTTWLVEDVVRTIAHCRAMLLVHINLPEDGRWRSASFADASIRLLNAWGSTLKKLNRSADRFLAADTYGYEIANAAEIMATYDGWSKDRKPSKKCWSMCLFLILKDSWSIVMMPK